MGPAIDAAWHLVRGAAGFLTEREARFLALAAACAPGKGAILEIGSFKGKSTVGLASISAHYRLGKIVTVDPHTAPSVTDPDLKGQASSWDDFRATLRAAGVEDSVEVHRGFSRDLAQDWNRKIRFLWIDGDHTYKGAKEDIDLFRRHLADGAIVALHDVLHTFEGPIRVFVEELLASNEFGPAGLCGSIGWAQYRPRDVTGGHAGRGARGGRPGGLIPLVMGGRYLGAIAKLQYKLWRSLVPHAAPDPGAWVQAVS